MPVNNKILKVISTIFIFNLVSLTASRSQILSTNKYDIIEYHARRFNISFENRDVSDVQQYLDQVIFLKGQEKVEGLSGKKNLYYSFSGYVGGDEGFKEEFFDSFNFYTLSRPQNSFFLSSSVRHSDVVSFFTDGAPLKIGGPDENLKSDLLQRLGLDQIGNITWEQKVIFNEGCFLNLIYINGELKKTIAWVNISKAISFPSGVGRGSTLPAACLVAGIAYHVGLHNIGVLDPSQIVVPEEGGVGALRVSDAVRLAIKILYQKEVAHEGIARKEFLLNAGRYATDNRIKLNRSGEIR